MYSVSIMAWLNLVDIADLEGADLVDSIRKDIGRKSTWYIFLVLL